MNITLLHNIFITSIIGSIAFLIQVYPRIYNRYFGVDTWKLLEMADIIRKNGKLPKTMTDKYLIDGPFDYPPIFLYVLSFFRKEFLEKNQWWLSPFINSFHSIIVFAITYFLTGNVLVALIAQIVYCLTPIVIIESSQLSARSFSQFIFSLTLITMLLSVHFQTPLLLWLTLFMSVVLVLSHKFALQALVFFSLAFSIWTLNFVYIAIPILAILIAIVVSRGYYLTVLKGHIAVLNFFRANMEYRFAHQIRGVEEKQNTSPDFINRLYNLLQKVPLLSLFGANSFVFLLFVMLILLRNADALSFVNISSPVYDFLLIWYGSLFIVAVLINLIKPLRFIGESERYLEYSAVPTAILLAILFNVAINSKNSLIYGALFVIWAIVLAYIPTLFIQRKLILKDKERSIHDDLWEMMDYINSLNDDVRIATIPMYLISPVSYFVNCKILSTESAYAHLDGLKDFYPIVKKPLADIFRQHKINYCLINEHYVSFSELDLSDKKIVKTVKSYVLIKI